MNVKGKIKNIYALRLKPGMDVMDELEKYCEVNNILNGYIATGMGSLMGARFFDPVELKDKKCGYGYSDPVILEGPIELISMSGMICHNDDGEILLHVHCCLSDGDGNAYAGHFIEGNKVLMTVDLLIAELEGINMGRAFDEDLEVFIFNPTQIG